jgi:hypothetical protein
MLKCASTLLRKFVELELDAEEQSLLKAIAALNNSDGTDLDNFGAFLSAICCCKLIHRF